MEQGILELNSHTESRPCQSAIERMAASFQEMAPDPASYTHPLYDLIDASPEDAFVFTSSGAEAVGQTIWSVFSEISRKHGKTQFIASSIEDAPTLQMLKRCEELGCRALIAPVDEEGRIDVESSPPHHPPHSPDFVSIAQGLTESSSLSKRSES